MAVQNEPSGPFPEMSTRGMHASPSSEERVVISSGSPPLPARLVGSGGVGPRWSPRAPGLVHLGLADPLAQRLRAHPSRPATALIAAYSESQSAACSRTQPDRLGLRVLVILDWHERDILPNLGKMSEIRDGSPVPGTR